MPCGRYKYKKVFQVRNNKWKNIWRESVGDVWSIVCIRQVCRFTCTSYRTFAGTTNFSQKSLFRIFTNAVKKIWNYINLRSCIILEFEKSLELSASTFIKFIPVDSWWLRTEGKVHYCKMYYSSSWHYAFSIFLYLITENYYVP